MRRWTAVVQIPFLSLQSRTFTGCGRSNPVPLFADDKKRHQNTLPGLPQSPTPSQRLGHHSTNDIFGPDTQLGSSGAELAYISIFSLPSLPHGFFQHCPQPPTPRHVIRTPNKYIARMEIRSSSSPLRHYFHSIFYLIQGHIILLTISQQYATICLHHSYDSYEKYDE